MRGREMQHPERAKNILHSLLRYLVETNIGKADQTPPVKQEGRMFSLQLAPTNSLKKPLAK